MKARNRFMAVLLAIMMVVTYMPALAFAEEVPDSEPPAETEEQVVGEENVGMLEEADLSASTASQNKANDAENDSSIDNTDDTNDEVLSHPTVKSATLILADNRELEGYANEKVNNFPYAVWDEESSSSIVAEDIVTVEYTGDDANKYTGTYKATLKDDDVVFLKTDDPTISLEYDYSGVGDSLAELTPEGTDDYRIILSDRFHQRVEIKGLKAKVITDDTISKIEYKPVKDIVLYDYLDSTRTDAGVIYDYDNQLPSYGDAFTIHTTEDADNPEVYKYREDPNNPGYGAFMMYEDYGYLEGEPVFLDNQFNEPWKAGNTDPYPVTVSYHGKTTTIEVEVKANPIESIIYEPNKDKIVFDDTELRDEDNDIDFGLRGNDEDGPSFYAVGDKVILNYSDEYKNATGIESETYEYQAFEQDEIYDFYCKESDRYLTDYPDYEPEYGHIGKNTITITYAEKSTTIELTVNGECDHAFELTYEEEVPATCVTPGTKAYAVCPNCNQKLIYDEEADKYVAVDDKQLVIPATGMHKLDPVAKKDATCKEEGYEAHYKCTVCNKLFSDAAGENEIEAPVVIDKVAHTWNAGTVTKEPTCTAKGEKTYTCTVCGETKTEDVDMLPHTLEKVDGVAPTYKKAGCEEYYKCTVCNKLFSDANGKNEIEEPVVIPSLKDDAEAKAAVAAEAAKTPGAAAVAAAEEAEKAAQAAAEEAEKDETLTDEEKAAAAQAYEDAKAATQKAKDAKAAAEAAAAVPAEVLDYSLPTIKNYRPTRGKTWIKARWKKLSKKKRKKVDGIEIQFSTNRSFTDGSTWTAKKTAKTKKIKGLARKTRYYTRVRTYKYIGGVKHVSRWSRIKNRKTR